MQQSFDYTLYLFTVLIVINTVGRIVYYTRAYPGTVITEDVLSNVTMSVNFVYALIAFEYSFHDVSLLCDCDRFWNYVVQKYRMEFIIK